MKNFCTKFKALIGLSILTAGLGGCSPFIDGWEILASQKFCEPHGGIDHIKTFARTSVMCRDGTYFEPKRAA